MTRLRYRYPKSSHSRGMVGVHRALSLSLLALLLALASSQSLQLGSIQGPGVQAGVEKMAQGLADVQNAANEKKQKHVLAVRRSHALTRSLTPTSRSLECQICRCSRERVRRDHRCDRDCDQLVCIGTPHSITRPLARSRTDTRPLWHAGFEIRSVRFST